jgi:hypothetical protein
MITDESLLLGMKNIVWRKLLNMSSDSELRYFTIYMDSAKMFQQISVSVKLREK